MTSVAGRPFLEYLLLQLKSHHVRDVVLCVGYKGEVIQEYFGRGERLGLRVQYSHETELRGTAGALKLAQELIRGDDVLVMNGDSFLDANLRKLLRFHKTHQCLATIALVSTVNPGRYGTVSIDDRGRIVGFVEKQAAEAGLINGGVYVFRREVLTLIPEDFAVSLEHQVFPNLVGAGLYGVPFRAYFVDIGVPEDCLQLQADPARLLRAVP